MLQVHFYTVTVAGNLFFYCLWSADVPRASLALGSPLVLSNIREGDDVYFECKVSARPNAETVEWLLNVSVPVKACLSVPEPRKGGSKGRTSITPS